ncbi:hypothetical protein [Vibrio penaeicida]|nr:hypothetical protein [Vibrio penaeicida]RTZ23039.1 hypothetical protein EKN09_11185 [Vibrio penaeicida]
MKCRMRVILVSIFVMVISGCADHVSLEAAVEMEKVGFWTGLWHGFILPFSMLGSMLWEEVAIYAIYNAGGWYDFGYFLGVWLLASLYFDL